MSKLTLFLKPLTCLSLSLSFCDFLFAQNVGVGLLAPVAKLHIKGSADNSQLIIDANSPQTNINPLIRLRKSTGTDLMWIHSDDTTNVFVGLKAGRVNVVGPQGVNNTFIGGRTGYSNTNGRDNVAIGTNALFSNVKSSYNTAIGSNALYTQSFSPGAAWYQGNNVAIGSEALYSNQPTSSANGAYNTAIGTSSLRSNTVGAQNMAAGTYSLYLNTTGSNNTAIGYTALNSNTSGKYNVALGTNTLFLNTIGEEITAIGSYALFNNVSGSRALAVGYKAMYNAYNYSQGWYNDNVAVGHEALLGSPDPSANNGNYNTAIGNATLWNNSGGYQNSALGYKALYENTVGYGNTALGYGSLYNNEGGSGATAIGKWAMYYTYNLTTAFDNANVAVGYEALRGFTNPANNTGNYNCAIGYQAMLTNTSGAYSAANGYRALYNNTIGIGNTAIGHRALLYNTVGNYNTSVGLNSWGDFDGSSNNVLLGAYTHIAASHSTVLGYGSYTNVNNYAVLGNSSTVTCGGYTNWTNFSDARFKTRVNENVVGLDFILRLRPVTYHMDVRGLNNFWGISVYGMPDSLLTDERKAEMDQLILNKENICMSGFIAQEVEKAASAVGYDFDGVVKPVHEKDHYRLAYGEFVVPLVKGMQEQQAMILLKILRITLT